jgi:hypothetical protein
VQETISEELSESLMADELYPGYDPLIDPWPVTCWGHPTAEQKEASAKGRRESTAIWRLFGAAYYEDVYKLREWLTAMMVAEAKAELWAREPWVRQWPELFS